MKIYSTLAIEREAKFKEMRELRKKYISKIKADYKESGLSSLELKVKFLESNSSSKKIDGLSTPQRINCYKEVILKIKDDAKMAQSNDPNLFD